MGFMLTLCLDKKCTTLKTLKYLWLKGQDVSQIVVIVNLRRSKQSFELFLPFFCRYEII